MTISIMNLQARHPTTKAATKPAASGAEPIACAPRLPFINSRKVSPRIGASTIRKENCATVCLRLPSSSPVAIVDPERDRPGSAATACATPIRKASR